MKFTLQTLTPLHTGGVNTGQMDRIQETGIIGSLRWWYEAVLRGLVGTGAHQHQVCDPTGESDGRCNYEKRDWVCRACDLFGATGWKRRFRFEVKERGVPLFNSADRIKVVAPDGNNGWYFASPFVSSPSNRISAEFTVLRHRTSDKSSVENDLLVITTLISKWGGLGAKTQHGFGAVRLELVGEKPLDVDAFLSGLIDNSDDQGFPVLGNMFFARLHLKDNTPDNWWKAANLGTGIKDKTAAWRLEDKPKAITAFSVPIAPAVKYKLRYGKSGKLYLPEADKCASYFFGEVRRNSNQKSKLNISNAYKSAAGRWEFRIWGWFPTQSAPTGVNRNQLIAELHGLVTDAAKYQPFWDSIFGAGIVDLSQSEWREKDASGHGRNTKDAAGNAIAPTTTADFLKCLLS